MTDNISEDLLKSYKFSNRCIINICNGTIVSYTMSPVKGGITVGIKY